MKKYTVLLLSLLLALSACTHGEPSQPTEAIEETIMTEPILTETQPQPKQTVPEQQLRLLPELQNPRESDFVPVADYLPTVTMELKYATEDNLTGAVIYPFADGYLRYGTVQKLRGAAFELEEMGLYLKLWDGFRPVSAQFSLWEIYPNPTYVADPNKGFSAHSRGNTVDITLVDAQGREVAMPTGFDDFSALADRDYSDCTPQAAQNAMLLQTVMEKHGFTGYFGEWWHFSDTVRYDVEHIFDPSVMKTIHPNCQEFISLRTKPDVTAEVITKIPTGERMTLLGFDGDFSLVDYQGLRGFVLTEFTAEQP